VQKSKGEASGKGKRPGEVSGGNVLHPSKTAQLNSGPKFIITMEMFAFFYPQAHALLHCEVTWTKQWNKICSRNKINNRPLWHHTIMLHDVGLSWYIVIVISITNSISTLVLVRRLLQQKLFITMVTQQRNQAWRLLTWHAGNDRRAYLMSDVLVKADKFSWC